MEIAKGFSITYAEEYAGLYQAHLLKTERKDSESITGSPLYSSAQYPTKEQAIQDAENHYQSFYAK